MRGAGAGWLGLPPEAPARDGWGPRLEGSHSPAGPCLREGFWPGIGQRGAEPGPVFQDRDLKQYLDHCGNLMSMHNVKVRASLSQTTPHRAAITLPTPSTSVSGLPLQGQCNPPHFQRVCSWTTPAGASITLPDSSTSVT